MESNPPTRQSRSVSRCQTIPGTQRQVGQVSARLHASVEPTAWILNGSVGSCNDDQMQKNSVPPVELTASVEASVHRSFRSPEGFGEAWQGKVFSNG
jgi:hypothetical protein